MATTPRAGETFGRYRIERELGRGGMGTVLLALDTQLNRRVALKVVSSDLAGDAEFLARFHREAEILTQLDSPHVITIFEHGEIVGVPYLAMQYVPGGDLGSLLRERGPVPPALAADMCAQVASALGDAHAAGVVHRDVKAANVLLRDPAASEPFAYLSDFGIAKSQSGDTDGLTRAGNVAGSWAYLSPERAKGGPATRASDIYALGCLLHVCLTGHAPYAGSDVEVAIAHVNEPVPQLPGAGPVVVAANALLARAMAKDPAQRPASAADLRADLVALAATARAAGQTAPLDLTPDGPGRAASAVPTPTSVPSPVPSPVPGASGPSGPSGPAAAGSGSDQRPPAPGQGGGRDGAQGDGRGRRTALIGVAAAAVLVLLGVGGFVLLSPDQAVDRPGDAGQAGSAEPVGPGVAGDWDGDGLGDVRLTRSYFDDAFEDLPVQLWTGVEDGEGFALEGPVEDAGSIGDVFGGDVDGDGRTDLVRFVEEDDDATLTISVFPGTADGLGEPVEHTVGLNTSTNSEASYGVADFDGDGLADLFLPTHRRDDYMRLLVARSTGDGFEAPQEFAWRGSEGRDSTFDELGIGDFDGDGKADLFSRAENKTKGLRFRVFRSTGTSFEKATTTKLENGLYSNMLSDFVAADVDGDGADELVSAIHNWIPGREQEDFGHELTVMEWTNGSFGTPQVWGPAVHKLAEYAAPDIAMSDIDGDGLEDVVQIADLDESDDAIDILWHRSTGEGFEEPVVLASPDCLREECSESAGVVGDIR